MLLINTLYFRHYIFLPHHPHQQRQIQYPCNDIIPQSNRIIAASLNITTNSNRLLNTCLPRYYYFGYKYIISDSYTFYCSTGTTIRPAEKSSLRDPVVEQTSVSAACTCPILIILTISNAVGTSLMCCNLIYLYPCRLNHKIWFLIYNRDYKSKKVGHS